MCLSPDEMNKPELNDLIGVYEKSAAENDAYQPRLDMLVKLREQRFPTVTVPDTGEELVYDRAVATTPRRGFSRAA